MKTLHQLIPSPNLFFFGRNFPCHDHYHDGFEDERTEHGSIHGQCAGILAREQTNATEALRCACRVCASNHPLTSHYYPNFGPPSITVRRCPDCRAGNHPIPPR